MSPASAPDSSPVRNTNAASASDACEAGRLSVGSAIRSQSAATARGPWPWRASQSPNVCDSSAAIALAQAHQRQRRARGARALGERQVRVAGERAGQMQRRRQRPAPQDRRL